MLLAIRYGPCEVSDLQDRMKRAVALLGPEEVKNIMREEGKIEVTLKFSYHLCIVICYRNSSYGMLCFVYLPVLFTYLVKIVMHLCLKH